MRGEYPAYRAANGGDSEQRLPGIKIRRWRIVGEAAGQRERRRYAIVGRCEAPRFRQSPACHGRHCRLLALSYIENRATCSYYQSLEWLRRLIRPAVPMRLCVRPVKRASPVRPEPSPANSQRSGKAARSGIRAGQTKVGDTVLFLRLWRRKLISKTEVQRQFAVNLPIVLHIPRVIRLAETEVSGEMIITA